MLRHVRLIVSLNKEDKEANVQQPLFFVDSFSIFIGCHTIGFLK